MLNKSALNTSSWEGEKIVMLVSNACNTPVVSYVLNQAWCYISVNNWGLVCNQLSRQFSDANTSSNIYGN